MIDLIECPADAPDVAGWPVVVTDAGNRFDVTPGQVQRALDLAAIFVRPGRRYEVRVELVEIEETPGFVGEGI